MKKWIFITTCTVGVLLSAVNVYNAQGAWNTLSGGLKQECYFSEKMRNYVEMREYADPPVLTSFLITPMCMSSTADMGINSSLTVDYKKLLMLYYVDVIYIIQVCIYGM